MKKSQNGKINYNQIGEIYQEELGRNKRREKGVFYTPNHIANYIIDYLKITKNQYILDPSCGAGSFLLSIIERLEKQGIKNLDNIFGVDLDEDVVSLLQRTIKETFPTVITNTDNIIHGNSLTEKKEVSTYALNTDESFKNVLKQGGFDLIIGNPPYVTLKKNIDYDISEFNYQDISKGIVNAATLIIGRSLELLKNKGILAFVLPKTMLYVSSYSKLRDYLLNNTKILHIVDLKSSFKNVKGEQMILIVQKETPSEEHKIEFKSLEKNKKIEECSSIFIEQSKFKNSNKIFVFETKKDYELIERLSKQGQELKEFVNGEIFRGLALPKKELTEEKSVSSSSTVVIGKTIQKFGIKQELYIKNSILENYKNKLPMIRKDKIILQNIFSAESGIISHLDFNNLITMDTVTNIIVENEEMAHYFFGLLNSKLLNYYLIFGLYGCSRTTMHTDKEYIGKLPIVLPTKEVLNKVIEVVKIVIKNKSDRISNRKELDDLIFSIYNIDADEQQHISKSLEFFISSKSKWW